jgi:hypothetical protein
LFAAAFVLHIVGGATDQGWLFAIAVVLIAAVTVAFPLLAVAIGRPWSDRERLVTAIGGGIAGAALTAGVFWAANGRSWEWWHVPASVAIAAAASAVALKLRPGWFTGGRESPSPG